MVCFVNFCFQICFAPQRRALFRHLNFQTASAMRCFEHLDFQMCFAPQQRAIFDRSPAPATLAILLFDPPVPHGAIKHWKNTVFRDFSTTFSRTLTFSLLPFPSLTLPTSACPSVHIVGSLTSKLPSITHTYIYI